MLIKVITTQGIVFCHLMAQLPQVYAVPDLPDNMSKHHATTPTQPMTQDGVPTLADLTRHVQTLVMQMQSLTTVVTGLANRPSGNNYHHSKAVVEKPQPFKGQGSEQARIFRSAFMVFASDREREFGTYHADGSPVIDVNGVHLMNQRKLITSFLTFMQEDAAIWARPQLELLADGKDVFNGTFRDCIEAFKLKFEPIQADQEARAKLSKLAQGNQTFSAHLAEFETWSPRTGWSDMDLYSRLYASLNQDYIERLSYFVPPPSTYSLLKDYGRIIDIQKQNKAAALDAQRGGSSGKSYSQPTTTPKGTGFQQPADPNAMDISATVDFSGLTGLTDRTKIRSVWQKAMKGCCRVCGAKNHGADKHPADTTCKHCGKTGHWSGVCLARLTGAPKAQNVSASVQGTVDPNEFSAAARAVGQSEAAGVPSASKGKERAKEDQGAELAALRDQIALQQKAMADMMARISASF
jgi:hypothetical protein